ncbi:polysaccharide deacetylase family protein [Clostridium malenominatum]|uniref:Polysaccharide deacetylase family protein n=1 Tax=Clostridium malenominatum TaxID=1539 RepID=A0ABN1J4Q6_9CLOT
MLSTKPFKMNLILFFFIFLMISTGCLKTNNMETSTYTNNNAQVIYNNTQVINKELQDSTLKVEKPLIYNDKGIPVLMYHSINYEKGNELMVPKENFREQMNYLKDNGYTTLTLNELYNFFLNNKPVPEKSVVITFDDGYKDNYTNAYPILKEFNFKAVVFVITNNMNNHKNFITSEQALELDNNGIEIQSHTVNHERLSTLDYNSQLKTLKESKRFLENLLHREVSYIAYPYGAFNNSTIKAAEEAGYKMAFTTAGTWSDKSDGLYTLDRVYISSKFDMNEFHRRLTNRNYKQKN